MLQTWPLKLASMLSKFKKKSRTMRLKIGKNLKTASLNSRFFGSKKRRVYIGLFTFENFESKRYCYHTSFPINNLKGAVGYLKNIVVWKSCSFLTLIQKYN